MFRRLPASVPSVARTARSMLYNHLPKCDLWSAAELGSAGWASEMSNATVEISFTPHDAQTGCKNGGGLAVCKTLATSKQPTRPPRGAHVCAI